MREVLEPAHGLGLDVVVLDHPPDGGGALDGLNLLAQVLLAELAVLQQSEDPVHEGFVLGVGREAQLVPALVPDLGHHGDDLLHILRGHARLGQLLREALLAPVLVGRTHEDEHVKPPGADDGGVEGAQPVRRHHEDVLLLSPEVGQLSQHGRRQKPALHGAPWVLTVEAELLDLVEEYDRLLQVLQPAEEVGHPARDLRQPVRHEVGGVDGHEVPADGARHVLHDRGLRRAGGAEEDAAVQRRARRGVPHELVERRGHDLRRAAAPHLHGGARVQHVPADARLHLQLGEQHPAEELGLHAAHLVPDLDVGVHELRPRRPAAGIDENLLLRQAVELVQHAVGDDRPQQLAEPVQEPEDGGGGPARRAALDVVTLPA
mmetsp:Transcript_23466/g.65728  ORF Transcript_23466/g.65728 Transcript_23466/m.65728 type:complete len:376 (+) Transcript_23466:195-1322(+)